MKPLTENINVSQHAINQFRKRTLINEINLVSRIIDIFAYAELITRQEAYEIVRDINIVTNRKNDDSLYYKVVVKQTNLQLNPLCDRLTFVFVVKKNVIVTFKTNQEALFNDSIYKDCNCRRKEECIKYEGIINS